MPESSNRRVRPVQLLSSRRDVRVVNLSCDDYIGLTLDDLRSFVARAEALGIKGSEVIKGSTIIAASDRISVGSKPITWLHVTQSENLGDPSNGL